jgi:TonB-dependent receptor
MFPLASKATRIRETSDPSALLRCGASLVAICAFAAAAPAFAQTGAVAGPGTAGQTAEQQATEGQQAVAQSTGVADSTAADDAADEAIVVTGIRQSLANSQNIKRNSDTVVDAITASDIGALPDRSVTEALSRVPGVAMNRFAGSNDPDHFSVEGSGVVVRGLSYVRSEFNGRDSFSTGVYGQALNFADVPAELLGSVEVYKNSTAEMIEGGLSGTVNLNTRKPFDNKGFHIGFDAEYGFGDMENKLSPTFSFLMSNTWDTGIGRIGLLGSVSYSQVLSRADGLRITNFQTRDNHNAIQANSTATLVCRNPLPLDGDTRTLPPGVSACGTGTTAGADGLADWADLRYAPVGGQFVTQDYDRERTGIAAAAQWESLDRRALLTLQFIRSDSTQKWGEHTFESGPDLAEYNTYPYGCRPNGNSAPSITDGVAGGSTVRGECPVGAGSIFQNYQYDDEGVFERGTITYPGTGWRAPDSGGTWRTPTGGIQQSLSRRQVDDENIVSDYGANLKFDPTEHWQINLDAQYVKAKHNNLDVSVFGSAFADQEIDLTGDLPSVIPHKPLWLSADWSGANCGTRPAGTCTPNTRINGENDQQYFSDPGNYFWRAAMDHIERSVGKEAAAKIDVAYKFNDDSFLKRAKFGARYADRDQTIRGGSTYNWGVISETWNGSGPIWMDDPASQGHVQFYDFPDFFRGQTPGPVGGFYYKDDLIKGYDTASAYFRSLNNMINGTGWRPMAQRDGVVAGTPWLPGEIQNTSERNINAYAMLSFGGDDVLGSVDLSGNIGVRFVDTKVVSEGAFTIPTRAQAGVNTPFSERCAVRPPPAGAPPGTPPSVPSGICTIGEASYNQLQTFANGANFPNTAVNTYKYFLPSLNLKFGLTRDLIMRFAASRALARAGMSDIRNFVTISTNQNDPARLRAEAGNPFLKPALSDQFDITLEWYFARVGSLTFDAFYKNIHNFFYQAITPREITNNGVTRTIDIRGQANYAGSGKVKGFEIAYQQTFDFLPGLLSGLGASGSYTYIDSKGLPVARGDTGPATNFDFGRLPLEQLSKHTVNAQVFYEKGPLTLRLAYNWRSRFLLTAQDVIFPYYPIYNAASGGLDGSVLFSVNKYVKVGIQAQNLNNQIVRTLQQFSSDGKLGDRSYFMSDRRFNFIIRGNF